MALNIQASFSAGELDPALHERTTLQKHKSGLATARNVIVGKTGRLISRPGRKYFIATKLANRKVKLHPLSNLGSFLEWGHEYVRVYTLAGTLVGDYAHAFTEAQLDDIQFVDGAIYGDIYVFLNKTNMAVLNVYSGFFTMSSYFDLYLAPTLVTDAITGTGYPVEYAATVVIDGQEGAVGTFTTSAYLLPISATQYNDLILKVGSTGNADRITEVKFYRRPDGAGAYGYIGSSSAFNTSGADYRVTFRDVGQAADYTHSPPTLNTRIKNKGLSGPLAMQSKTGIVYQQRLILSYNNLIEASRTGVDNNFYRDYPLSADSSLSFKSGTGGDAFILRFLEADGGLLAFTTSGVYAHRGELSPTNLAMDKIGNWVIDYRVPPISVPGGVLFIDILTNTIRQLVFSQEAGYLGQEASIFSDHLFTGRRVVSWAFEDGDTPVLWVVFYDGKFASFTYERDHEMRAWTRHDSSSYIKIENVIATIRGSDLFTNTSTLGKTIFVVNKSGTRFIETNVPRYVTSEVLEADPEADKGESIAFMDSMVTYNGLMNGSLAGSDEFVFTATNDDWRGPLTLTCGTSALFPNPGAGAIGTILRYFNPDNGESVDLEVTARASDNSITVEPSCEFPAWYAAADPRLYLTKATLTGLTHLNDEDVSVIMDGYVIASVNNDIEKYPLCTVSGGILTLPNSLRGAIVHIGRPITADVETLDIDTIEQRPVHFESKTANKLYVKTHRSRGLYAGNKFPDDDKVGGVDERLPMQTLDTLDVDYTEEIEITSNKYQAPTTKRVEVTLPGDWKSQGRICLRQVDPLHFEILSIVPDIEDLRR